MTTALILGRCTGHLAPASSLKCGPSPRTGFRCPPPGHPSARNDEVQYCDLTPLVSREHGVRLRSERGVTRRLIIGHRSTPISHIRPREDVPGAQRLEAEGADVGPFYGAPRLNLRLEPQGLPICEVVRPVVPLQNLVALHVALVAAGSESTGKVKRSASYFRCSRC